jgi:hypothetical protein
MQEVTITAKFKTGTTAENPQKAMAIVEETLLGALAKANIASVAGTDALFLVEIISSKSEKL